jgi:hypothetical protein
MIDPVGAGFSRPAGKFKKDVAEFILGCLK